MNRISKLRNIVAAFFLVGVAVAFLGNPHSAEAHGTCSNPINSGGSGGWAGLILNVKVNGVLTDGIDGTITDGGNYSFVEQSGYSPSGHKTQVSFTSGQNVPGCSGNKGQILFGDYSSFGSLGNGIVLDCEQEPSPGSFSSNATNFTLHMGGSPDGKPGHWNDPSPFQVQNGTSTPETVNWIDDPPPANGDITGDKYSDRSGNLLPDSLDNGNVTISGTTKTSSPFTFNNENDGSHYLSVDTYKGYVPVKVIWWHQDSSDNKHTITNSSGTLTGNIDVNAGDTTVVHIYYKGYGEIQGDKFDTSGNSINALAGANADLDNTTDYTGSFDFSNLDPGTHTLTLQSPYNGYEIKGIKYRDVTAGDDYPNNPQSTSGRVKIDVPEGHTIQVRATYQKLGEIRGDKFDAAGNSIPAIAGANVSVSGNVDYTDSFDFTNLDPGTHTLTAQSPYNGYSVYAIYYKDYTTGQKYPKNPQSTNDTVKIDVPEGDTIQVRILYKKPSNPSDNAACASPTTANPAVVATGSTFKYDMAMRNTGAHTWTAPGYRLKASFDDGDPLTSIISPLTVARTDTATFDKTNLPHNNFTFTAPTTPGTYDITYQMIDGNDSEFGAECTDQIDVQNIYDYVPRISTYNGGTATLPSTRAILHPGDTITVNETILNNYMGSTALGDPYSWAIYTYNGSYTQSPPNINFSPTNSVIGSGSSTSGISHLVSDLHSANYTVPPTTPNGTHVCFYGGVSPAQSPSPNILNRYSTFASASPAADDNTNVRGSLVNGVATKNDLCFEVSTERQPQLEVDQGDSHAGGNISTDGISCAAPATGTGNVSGSGGNSYSEYVTSAYGTISGFSSGKGSNGLTLSNLATNGKYGYICRPDLAKVAANYSSTHPATPAIVIPTGTTSISMSYFTQNRLYQHFGPLTITGGQVNVGTRATLYNEGNVTVTGNISFSTGAANSSNVPSFGLITGAGGNILVSNNVTEMDGFYFASNSTPTSSDGYINTCLEHAPNQTGDCPNKLKVIGSLTAHNIYLNRTGPSGLPGSVVSEQIVQSGDIYLLPPPAFETQANTPAALPSFYGEYAPLY